MEPPHNNLITPLLTDLYQLTMCYGYWHAGKHNDASVFELFFRKNPFKGQFTIFAGLEEVCKHLHHFRFSEDDIEYLRNNPTFQHCEPEFFDDYLKNLDCHDIKVYAMKEGTVVFPREALLGVEGPLALVQLLETTLLTLVNYPSLVATNAARMRLAAGHDKKLVEFGLRRAQGADGGFSASKYCMIGGFDGTSNVLAGKLLGVPIVGTHAHAFVQSYTSLEQVREMRFSTASRAEVKDVHHNFTFFERVLYYRENVLGKLQPESGWLQTNDGELAAFISYAFSFPSACVCLIDTYDTIESGLRNFIFVALALDDFGYKPLAVRLDSGDLSALSYLCWQSFHDVAELLDRPFLRKIGIVASNDINEDVLLELGRPDNKHKITMFGIGTHLVTCQKQPALGCVFKLVELNGQPRIKLSEELEKVLIPGKKDVYRLYGKDGSPIVDCLIMTDESTIPETGKRFLCRHPFNEQNRLFVIPSKVVKLNVLVYDGSRTPSVAATNLTEIRAHAKAQLGIFLEGDRCKDVLHLTKPKPFGVMVSDVLYKFLHRLWENQSIVHEVR